jgi:hypothetical protein
LSIGAKREGRGALLKSEELLLEEKREGFGLLKRREGALRP